MISLGLAIDFNKRSTLRAVLLESEGYGGSEVEILDDFSVPSTVGDSLATQLKELADAATGRVQSLRPDVIVLRRADQPPRPNNSDGPRQRLMAEGAVAAAVRALVVRTHIRNGKECGVAYGVSKDDLDRMALGLVQAALVPACAAALSGLARPDC